MLFASGLATQIAAQIVQDSSRHLAVFDFLGAIADTLHIHLHVAEFGLATQIGLIVGFRDLDRRTLRLTTLKPLPVRYSISAYS